MSARTASINHQTVTLTLPKRFLGAVGGKLPPGVIVLACGPEEIQPEFIRLPSAGKKRKDGKEEEPWTCPITGLQVDALRSLIKQSKGKVKTHHIRQEGAVKGITLIYRQSLVNYVLAQPPPEAFADHTEEGDQDDD